MADESTPRKKRKPYKTKRMLRQEELSAAGDGSLEHQAQMLEANVTDIEKAAFLLVRVSARCEIVLRSSDDAMVFAQKELAEIACIDLGVLKERAAEVSAKFYRGHAEAKKEADAEDRD